MLCWTTVTLEVDCRDELDFLDVGAVEETPRSVTTVSVDGAVVWGLELLDITRVVF